MYLLAKQITKSNLLTEWKGRSGRFVRTFGMNSKRNKNEWRATWDSIKRNIHTALGYPGIEYEACVDAECDLDHVEAESFDENVEKQKPFSRTNIIDYVIDEANESVDLIHEVLDEKFWGRLNTEELYVSPLIWPESDGVKVLGEGRIGLPIIDTTNWRFVHDAFLTKDPAYGTDTATVKTMCEGEGCDVHMLGAKYLGADTTTANSDNLEHLQEIPLLYKHKGSLVLLSASACVQRIIKKKKEDGIDIDDQALAIAYSECGESKKAKSSFKTCSCSAKQNKMDHDEEKELRAKKEELEAKLRAAEEKEKEHEKAKSHEAKKGRYAKLFANTEDEEREKMVARLKAGEEDKDELKAMEEVHKDMKSKKGKEDKDDDEKKDLKARLTRLEAKESKVMIDDMLLLQSHNGLAGKELNEYHATLKAKSYDIIESKYEDLKPMITTLKANITPDETQEVKFNGTGDYAGLSGKTFDEILEASA